MPLRPKILRLPVDPVARTRVIAERSAPDPKRPRLSDELEKRLEVTERQSAVCYAEMEEMAHQIRMISANLSGDEITDVGATPIPRHGEIRGAPRR